MRRRTWKTFRIDDDQTARTTWIATLRNDGKMAEKRRRKESKGRRVRAAEGEQEKEDVEKEDIEKEDMEEDIQDRRRPNSTDHTERHLEE